MDTGGAIDSGAQLGWKIDLRGRSTTLWNIMSYFFFFFSHVMKLGYGEVR